MSFISTYDSASIRGWQAIGEKIGPYQVLNFNGRIFDTMAINADANLNSRKLILGDSRGGGDGTKVYVYTLGSNSNVTIDGVTGSGFGAAVSINSDATYLGIGAPSTINGNVSFNRGKVHIYKFASNTWSEEANIIPAGNTYDLFGQFVSIDNNANRILIGAYLETYANTNNRGALYVYSRSGNTWALEQKIEDPNKTANNGSILSALNINGNGDTIVTNFRSATSNVSNIYIYNRSNTTWTLNQTINSNIGQYLQQQGLSDSGNNFICAENTGNSNVRIYTYNGSNYVYNTDLTSPTTNYDFGWDADITDNVAIVSDPRVPSGGYNKGRVYVYKLDNSTNAWSYFETLSPPNEANRAYNLEFGKVLTISQNNKYISIREEGEFAASDDIAWNYNT